MSVNNGGGTMAQFNCFELGGAGQWMQGGMTMVGNMFDYGLKNTVNNLCAEIANALNNNQIFETYHNDTYNNINSNNNNNQWWIIDLGVPFSSGSQNNMRYAIFPNRLAIELNGEVTVYDTLNHNIGGISQQQSNGMNLTFSSQFGTVDISSLPIVYGNSNTLNISNISNISMSSPIENTQSPSVLQDNQATPHHNSLNSVDQMIQSLEKLSKLKDSGIITELEFNTAKQKLLNNL